MLMASYEIDGRIKYEKWDMTATEAKIKARDLMRTGKVQFVSVEHVPSHNSVMYLRKRSKHAWHGSRVEEEC